LPLHIPDRLKPAWFHIALLFLLSAALLSCSSQKKVQRRGGYLLVKNTVKVDHPSIPVEEVEGFIQQKANPEKLSLFRPGLFIYEATLHGKQSKLKKRLREKWGKAPVILDTNLAARSEYNIRLYLQNKGFYHPAIHHEFRYKRALATATYRIETGKPYVIHSLQYDIPDSLLRSYFFSDTAFSLIRRGMPFDTYLMDDERDRITQNLRNQGYFELSKSNITFKADTNNSDLRTSLTLRIRPLETGIMTRDSLASDSIPRYFFRNIYIIPDVDQFLKLGGNADTVPYSFSQRRHDTIRQTLFLIQGPHPRLNPVALSNSVILRTGQAYNQEMVTQTYKRLIGMPIVRSASIGLSVPENIPVRGPGSRWLDCTIRLTRNPVNLLSLGTEGTNSGGSLGMGFNALYQNRNIFRRAETFKLKIHTGAELQGNLPQTGGDRKLWLFNTLETGFETGIEFPRLLVPFYLFNYNQRSKAHTSFAAGYGFESRPDYSRNVTTFSASYSWSSSEMVKHVFTPLELNFVGIEKDSAFQAYLNNLTDPQFIGQYSNHLLTMIRYSLIWSNLAMTKEKNLFFVRLNGETSGNVFHSLDRLTNSTPTAEGYYQRFGVRYAQYFRLDVDYRKFWQFSTKRRLAFRVMSGFGIPYGNSEGIPFEKSFWLGGANDMRGWRLRSLGPGAYTNDSVRYDRTGDMMLYSSLEYRFPIYSFLNGGIFTDAGNIWIRKDNPDFQGGTFYLKNLGQQLALDAGLGLRFDFSFFIFRLDWAFRMKNPEYANQWFQPEDFRLRKAVWNFGIGYPF